MTVNNKIENNTWIRINQIFAIVMGLSAVVWLLQWHTFGLCMALATFVAAFYILKRNRWAYFAIAIICFGLLRTAMDDGHDFYAGYQSWGKLFYVVALIFALILHEKAALKKRPDDEQNIPE
jgi:hypothetical protein